MLATPMSPFSRSASVLAVFRKNGLPLRSTRMVPVGRGVAVARVMVMPMGDVAAGVGVCVAGGMAVEGGGGLLEQAIDAVTTSIARTEDLMIFKRFIDTNDHPLAHFLGLGRGRN